MCQHHHNLLLIRKRGERERGGAEPRGAENLWALKRGGIFMFCIKNEVTANFRRALNMSEILHIEKNIFLKFYFLLLSRGICTQSDTIQNFVKNVWLNMGYFRNVECPREMGRDFIFHVKRENPPFQSPKIFRSAARLRLGASACGAREVSTPY